MGPNGRGDAQVTPTMPRSVRVPADLWNQAVAIANTRGETVTAVVIQALQSYVDKNGEPS